MQFMSVIIPHLEDLNSPPDLVLRSMYRIVDAR